MPEVQQAVAALCLRYVTPEDLGGFVKEFDGHILGLVAFGETGSTGKPSRAPFTTAVNLSVLGGGDTAYEAWVSDTPVVQGRERDVLSACNGELLFGYITIPEATGANLEALAFRAYSRLFEFIAQQGYPHLLRIWNYFPQINASESGLERYRSFNVGRHEAFVASGRTIRAGSVPAACALGSSDGPLIVYFLAGKQAGLAIENPRQTSAYNYPPSFGPRSPTFARAILLNLRERQTLFISGTASVVGYQSLHEGDLEKQARETFLNLRVLLDQAGLSGDQFHAEQLCLKVYVRHAGDLSKVKAMVTTEFGTRHQAIYLQSDICRAELLLEIEGVYISR